MRGSTVQCRCECCKRLFTARLADRNRGWGRFCSKSCKAVKQEARTGQNAHYQASIRPNLPYYAPPGVSIDHEEVARCWREYGGTPTFDRYGAYEGFVDGGFDNMSCQNEGED